jgi:predicted ribosome quality control (RQC) complex YloA/Tae2 family protein
MALDGLVIHSLTAELQTLVGGKINKLHQPSAHDIVMQIRSLGQSYRLLLSANPTYPRIHLSEQIFVNPMEAPMFCMLMRKHYENGTILSIEQIGAERIIHMRIQHRDELGDQRIKTIIIELMGRHSNIILMDQETNAVLDGIHHVTPAISAHRVILPGSSYITPPDQQKLNPFETSLLQLTELLTQRCLSDSSEITSRFWEQALVDILSGVSPLVAREIVFRSPLTGITSTDAALVAEHFTNMIQHLKSNKHEPNIVTPASGKMNFSIISLTHLEGDREHYSSISECLETFYGDKAERDIIKQRVADLLRLLQNERNKNISKLDKLRETLEEAKGADRHRIMGELLTASLHLAKKGQKEIDVINYYDEQQAMIKINLDPLLSPSENAQRYFKKYNKMKNSVAAVEEQITATHDEIQYLDSLLQQLASATVMDIEEIREELIEQGYLRRRGKVIRKKRKNDRPSLTCFTSSEGIPIYVGKNNTQNEYLTNRLAAPNDTWLHTKDIPGSHVVIRGSDFSDVTMNEAAMLSAYYSQAKESSQVPVDYTLIRHVRKPSGAKPGFVIYDKQKTLFITPDEQHLKALKQEQK